MNPSTQAAAPPATRPAAAVAPATPATADRKSAIDLLPAEFREPVRFFFGFFSDTLRGTLGICTRFRWWIREEGLTAEEAVKAMRRLMTPEKAAAIDTAPRVLALLAAEIDQLVQRRRALERRRSDREKAEREKAASATVEALKAAIGRMG